MIKVSPNQFVKKTPATGSAFTDKNTNTSATAMTKKTANTGLDKWEGTNLTDTGFEEDINNPSPWGANEAGGFAHFQTETKQPNINH